jgi:alkylation response protein AidB-like acyl-CoA dehydrogenase
MRFTFTDEQQAFRDEVCTFLRQELTPEVVARHRDPSEATGYAWDFCLAFRKRLAERGYLGLSWPPDYGGAGKDMISQLILAEEMEYHRAPGLDGTITYIPPAIMAYGSEDQKRTLLPRIAAGELTFFLGYSEPGAGSDLASLRTRAVADGDAFVISGDKAFSSEAQHADYGWVAVRTDPEAPKHRGISLFIVSMQSPGISMGGFTTISGWRHATVTFDNVRVPRANLVGELNRGWYYIMGAIDFERASLGNPGMTQRLFDRLVEYCQTTHRNGTPLIKDPVVRQRLAELYAEVEGVRLMSYRVGSMHAEGLQPQHETSLSVLVKRETVHALQSYGVELLGPMGQLRLHDPLAPAGGGIVHDYLDKIYFSFAAGGFDITRNVIAARGLGLPRG